MLLALLLSLWLIMEHWWNKKHHLHPVENAQSSACWKQLQKLPKMLQAPTLGWQSLSTTKHSEEPEAHASGACLLLAREPDHLNRCELSVCHTADGKWGNSTRCGASPRMTPCTWPDCLKRIPLHRTAAAVVSGHPHKFLVGPPWSIINLAAGYQPNILFMCCRHKANKWLILSFGGACCGLDSFQRETKKRPIEAGSRF